jgi:formylglycine-generating enzyme required for sulfatase activity
MLAPGEHARIRVPLGGSDGGVPPFDLAGCGACDGGGTMDCPPGMIAIAAPLAGASYCIDAMEVTNDDYAAYLANSPQPAVHDRCTWSTSLTPTCNWPNAMGNYPVACVDWCMAYAYCAGVGKRLCGRIEGGAVDYTKFTDLSQDQWYNACSRAGGRVFPYGQVYVSSNCNGFENQVGAAVPVGSMPNCEGGWPGLRDMSGNIAEWEDSCSLLSTPQGDTCRTRGGNFDSGQPSLQCDGDSYLSRSFTSDSVGFRCCK